MLKSLLSMVAATVLLVGTASADTVRIAVSYTHLTLPTILRV